MFSSQDLRIFNNPMLSTQAFNINRTYHGGQGKDGFQGDLGRRVGNAEGGVTRGGSEEKRRGTWVEILGEGAEAMPQNCTEKTMMNKEFVVDDSFKFSGVEDAGFCWTWT